MRLKNLIIFVLWCFSLSLSLSLSFSLNISCSINVTPSLYLLKHRRDIDPYQHFISIPFPYLQICASRFAEMCLTRSPPAYLDPLSPIYYNLEICDWYFWDTTYIKNEKFRTLKFRTLYFRTGNVRTDFQGFRTNFGQNFGRFINFLWHFGQTTDEINSNR